MSGPCIREVAGRTDVQISSTVDRLERGIAYRAENRSNRLWDIIGHQCRRVESSGHRSVDDLAQDDALGGFDFGRVGGCAELGDFLGDATGVGDQHDQHHIRAHLHQMSTPDHLPAQSRPGYNRRVGRDLAQEGRRRLEEPAQLDVHRREELGDLHCRCRSQRRARQLIDVVPVGAGRGDTTGRRMWLNHVAVRFER